jgi:hypothetical protein
VNDRRQAAGAEPVAGEVACGGRCLGRVTMALQRAPYVVANLQLLPPVDELGRQAQSPTNPPDSASVTIHRPWPRLW